MLYSTVYIRPKFEFFVKKIGISSWTNQQYNMSSKAFSQSKYNRQTTANNGQFIKSMCGRSHWGGGREIGGSEGSDRCNQVGGEHCCNQFYQTIRLLPFLWSTRFWQTQSQQIAFKQFTVHALWSGKYGGWFLLVLTSFLGS